MSEKKTVLKKESAEKEEQPPIKKKYKIKVEGMAPVSVQYDIWAHNENEAYYILDKQPHLLKLRERPNIDLPRMKKVSVQITNLLNGLVEFVKRF